jgi:septum formation protein
LVKRLAIAKSRAVFGRGEVVIGADTVVDLDDRVVGKPRDADDALHILRSLSGRAHRVHTGVVVQSDLETVVAIVTSEVAFVDAGDDLLRWYVSTGEPFDKAGAYGLQGAGALMVESVHGSTTNVIGLPLAELNAIMLDALVRLRTLGGGGPVQWPEQLNRPPVEGECS